MRKSRWAIGLLSCTILFSTGCGVHRGNVTALTHEQQQYYAKLEDTLKQKRQTLTIALEEQLKVDRTREQNLLDWRTRPGKGGGAPGATSQCHRRR